MGIINSEVEAADLAAHQPGEMEAGQHPASDQTLLRIGAAARLVGCSPSTLRRFDALLEPVHDEYGVRCYTVETLLAFQSSGKLSRVRAVREDDRNELTREVFALFDQGLDPRTVVGRVGNADFVLKLHRIWRQMAPPKDAAAPRKASKTAPSDRDRWEDAVNTPGTPEYEEASRRIAGLLASYPPDHGS